MKTIKKLADELKISKQKLYRYVKEKHINDVVVVDGKFLIDDTLEKALKKAFKTSKTKDNSTDKVHHNSESKPHQISHQNKDSDAEMIKFLKEELKRAHDRTDHLQKMLENQQILMLKNQERLENLEYLPQKKHTILSFFKSKKGD